MLADLLREAPGQQRRDRRPVQGAGGGAARRRCDRAADDLVLAGRPGSFYEAELEDLLPPVRAHWEGLRAPRKARAASAPQSRAPAPAASASTTARSVSSSRLVQRPVFAAGTAKPPRGGVTTPAAGRDADPKGSTQGSCPRGCRAAPRGETRARFAGGWSMINGGGLEPAGADFMTLKRGSPRQTQRPSIGGRLIYELVMR